MNRVRLVLVSAITVCVYIAVPLFAQTPSVPRVTIRLYDSFGLKSGQMQTAQDLASAILEEADVEVSWRECWRDAGALRGDMRVCGDTLQATEVIVRIVADRSEQRGPRLSLGYSLVQVTTGAATLATVYGNRVAQLAQGWHVNHDTVMGRAIAHEVGHLLLGSGEHSRDGLMRAHWSNVALVEDDHAWTFSPEEARHIRAELVARELTTGDLLAARVHEAR